MLLLAEQAAPSWVPVVAFAIPALIVGAVLVPALRRRRAASRARRSQKGRRGPEGIELGSAAAIGDPSAYSVEGLLEAMAVRPEDHGPTGDGMPHDEGWAGTMLGLKSRMSASSNVLEPHVYWGERQHGQVFVRVGPDEKIEGGTRDGRVAMTEHAVVIAGGGPAGCWGPSWRWRRSTSRSSSASRSRARRLTGRRW